MESMKDPVTPARAGYHHGDLRQALLEATLRLVAEHGPEGFSLREAAREVGVSPAAAYRHFADKPAVLAALAAEGHGRLAAAMEKVGNRDEAAPPKARAVARFVGIGQAYVEFALKNPSFFRLMFGPALKAPGFEAYCAPSGRNPYEILSITLDELAASGAIPPERRANAEVISWSCVHGFSTLLVDGALPLGARARAEAYRALVRALLQALGCEEELLPPPPMLDVQHPDAPKRAAPRSSRSAPGASRHG
jgi:AcrR family transcriptional regulator